MRLNDYSLHESNLNSLWWLHHLALQVYLLKEKVLFTDIIKLIKPQKINHKNTNKRQIKSPSTIYKPGILLLVQNLSLY